MPRRRKPLDQGELMAVTLVCLLVLRVNGMGIPNVLALVNPRAYFLALAAAEEECHLSGKWVLFRVPAHPRHLIPAVREVVPVVRAVAGGAMI